MRVHLTCPIRANTPFTLLHYRKNSHEAVFLVQDQEVAFPVIHGDPEDYQGLLGISGCFSFRGDLLRKLT